MGISVSHFEFVSLGDSSDHISDMGGDGGDGAFLFSGSEPHQDYYLVLWTNTLETFPDLFLKMSADACLKLRFKTPKGPFTVTSRELTSTLTNNIL